MTNATAWRETTLGALASVSRGASPRPIASSRWFDSKSDVRWVRIADVSRSDGRTLRVTTQALSADGIARSRFLKPCSLIMSIAATVGIPVITGVPTCIHDGFVALENLKADQRFLLYLLKASEPKLREAGQSGSQMNVNTGIVRGLTVRVPEDRKEQERIAEALWDLDDQIVTLESLIVKKQAIKQALMQQLLTGKTRLLGFSGSVVERRLSDVSVKIQDGTHFSPQVGGSAFKYITSKNIGVGEMKLDAVETISEPEHRKIYSRCDTRFGDLLITKDGANTGNAALNPFREQISLLSSVAFVRCDPRRASEAYVLQYLLSRQGRQQVRDAMTGNAITRLTLAKIRDLVVPMPEVDEQRALARVLGDVDAEIAAVRARLRKAGDVKRGMMQELLTGRTRLSAKEGVA